MCKQTCKHNMYLNLGRNEALVDRRTILLGRLASRLGESLEDGYLPKSVKKEVCDLVDLLEQDEDIARMYELWYQAKCAVYNTYTDNDPIKKPLSQEEVFKPIRNALIREANALGAQLDELDTSAEEEENTTPTDDDEEAPSESVPKPNPQPAHSNPTAPQTPSATSGGAKHTKSKNGYIATSIARFGNSLSRTFRDNF